MPPARIDAQEGGDMAGKKDVGQDRLDQKTGSDNAYGGYEKVSYGGGKYGMEKSK